MTLVTKSSYIDGAFVALGSSTDILENRNPSNPGEVIERFERAGVELTEHAIAAARLGTQQPAAARRGTSPIAIPTAHTFS